ncbi:MAG: hypothetical protein A4E40_00807 [Methanoregulaceae archaeon PtaU1.Bin059]|nr:MAG: hypothetical protein A4E40_00807 [Methanoregulaceae archaeon PtaU1.Bin059]
MGQEMVKVYRMTGVPENEATENTSPVCTSLSSMVFQASPDPTSRAWYGAVPIHPARNSVQHVVRRRMVSTIGGRNAGPFIPVMRGNLD